MSVINVCIVCREDYNSLSQVKTLTRPLNDRPFSSSICHKSIEEYHCRFQFQARLGFSLRCILLEEENIDTHYNNYSTSQEATVGTIAMANATRQIIHF